jgi:DNA damage-binding protein 1
LPSSIFKFAGDPPPDSVRLLDSLTFEMLSVFQLGKFELACSIATMTLSDDVSAYYVVGTAFTPPGELESTKGRILVFKATEGKLSLVAEKDTHGSVYNVTPFQNKLLAAINSRLQLYKWDQQDDGSRELVPECSHAGHVLLLYLDTRGDFVLLGKCPSASVTKPYVYNH